MAAGSHKNAEVHDDGSADRLGDPETRGSLSDPRPLRALVLVFGLSALVGDLFASALLVLDAPPWDPRVQVVVRADLMFRFGLFLAGLGWLVSWLPGLSRHKQLFVLRLSGAIVVVAGSVWLGWIFIGSRATGA